MHMVNEKWLFRRLLFLASFIGLLSGLCCPADLPASKGTVFEPLEQKLIKDGFPERRVSMLFAPSPVLQIKTIATTFRLRESKLNYDQFLAPASVGKAREFMSRHESTLSRAEAKYGVDRRVITAILLVETHFGSYTGKTPTLAILATFALMSQEEYRDKVWTLLTPEDRARWTREAFDRKMMDRSQWAYREICALLELSKAGEASVKSLKGSVMGAVGWCQFLPSSLVRYGVDGNGDSRVDLFQPADAIHSVANYLRGYGWCEAKTETDRENVIHCYNKSRPYVGAVLGLAARLRE